MIRWKKIWTAAEKEYWWEERERTVCHRKQQEKKEVQRAQKSVNWKNWTIIQGRRGDFKTGSHFNVLEIFLKVKHDKDTYKQYITKHLRAQDLSVGVPGLSEGGRHLGTAPGQSHHERVFCFLPPSALRNISSHQSSSPKDLEYRIAF